MTSEEISKLSDEELNILCAIYRLGWERLGADWHTSPAHEKRTIITEGGAKWKEDYLNYNSKGAHDVLVNQYRHRIYLCEGHDSDETLPYCASCPEAAIDCLNRTIEKGWILEMYVDSAGAMIKLRRMEVKTEDDVIRTKAESIERALSEACALAGMRDKK